jgi:hypothetical protein
MIDSVKKDPPLNFLDLACLEKEKLKKIKRSS